MQTDFVQIYERLFDWCKQEDFAGYDPFDGLNSRIFQALPFKHFAVFRLAWLQMVKRSPRNLRPMLKIEKGINPKGIALFALAELSRYRVSGDEIHAESAKDLLKTLISLQIETSKYAAFGYNFDWQSRAFFAPQGTPTIVPTAFACQAFLEGYEIFGDEQYLHIGKQICEFIVNDLNRIDETDDEVSFSYTPLDKSVIFNASLLAGECLAKMGILSENQAYLGLAEKTVRYVLRRQNKDGSWAYGSKMRHKWIDNFHTAYVLVSIYRLQKLIPSIRDESARALECGYKFWVENFFLADGMPKYYNKESYPADIHSASAAVAGLAELSEFDQSALLLAENVLNWTCTNLRDAEGFFYYQKKKSSTIKTPFIRWSEAWTSFALARFLEAKQR